MDSKATKSSHPTATHHEVSADTDSTLNRSYLPNSNSSGEPKHARPGEDIMKSDDPSTAALRAWAEDKQMQVPGSNGSFQLGQISMGSGAVSGGPMFLPRKEFVVEPPHHSLDHGPVDVVKHEEGGEGKKKRGSISSLFKRKGEGRSESETEVQEHVAKHDEDGEGGKKIFEYELDAFRRSGRAGDWIFDDYYTSTVYFLGVTDVGQRGLEMAGRALFVTHKADHPDGYHLKQDASLSGQ